MTTTVGTKQDAQAALRLYAEEGQIDPKKYCDQTGWPLEQCQQIAKIVEDGDINNVEQEQLQPLVTDEYLNVLTQDGPNTFQLARTRWVGNMSFEYFLFASPEESRDRISKLGDWACEERTVPFAWTFRSFQQTRLAALARQNNTVVRQKAIESLIRCDYSTEIIQAMIDRVQYEPDYSIRTQAALFLMPAPFSADDELRVKFIKALETAVEKGDNNVQKMFGAILIIFDQIYFDKLHTALKSVHESYQQGQEPSNLPYGLTPVMLAQIFVTLRAVLKFANTEMCLRVAAINTEFYPPIVSLIQNMVKAGGESARVGLQAVDVDYWHEDPKLKEFLSEKIIPALTEQLQRNDLKEDERAELVIKLGKYIRLSAVDEFSESKLQHLVVLAGGELKKNMRPHLEKQSFPDSVKGMFDHGFISKPFKHYFVSQLASPQIQDRQIALWVLERLSQKSYVSEAVSVLDGINQVAMADPDPNIKSKAQEVLWRVVKNMINNRFDLHAVIVYALDLERKNAPLGELTPIIMSKKARGFDNLGELKSIVTWVEGHLDVKSQLFEDRTKDNINEGRFIGLSIMSDDGIGPWHLNPSPYSL